MPFVKAQCTSCGAALEVDNAKEAAICPYCHMPYIVEKAINNYTTNITNNINAQVVNIINQREDYEIIAGTLVKYSGKSADLVIPDEVTKIDKDAIPKDVKSIVFGKGTTIIDEIILRDCKNLISVTIPDSVTKIDFGAFDGCSSLTRITIPDSVTSIGGKAFSRCTRLTEIEIPNSVTKIGYNAFDGCSSLTSITIPDSVESIGNQAFYFCKNLTSITIPSSVINIGEQIISLCDNLTNLVVDADNPKYDSRDNCNAIIETASNKLVVGCNNTMIPKDVTSIGKEAFYGCRGLKAITIPSNVKSIGERAFYCCGSLTSLTFANGVERIGQSAFEKCINLTSIIIPDSVTRIDYWAFNYCPKLNYLELPKDLQVSTGSIISQYNLKIVRREDSKKHRGVFKWK